MLNFVLRLKQIYFAANLRNFFWGGSKTYEDKDCVDGRTWAECVGEVL
jgi:hypothetical protein